VSVKIGLKGSPAADESMHLLDYMEKRLAAGASAADLLGALLIALVTGLKTNRDAIALSDRVLISTQLQQEARKFCPVQIVSGKRKRTH
jgi:hypothetical protein